MAGPALIAGVVLVLLHDLAFGARLPSQHPDVLAFWLPTYCFLGESLAAGHVPAWNPHVMAGLPFAADPQSGWMYLLPMALFSTASCGAAMRWMIVLQPVLAGLGLYAFLRSEGLGRPAATTGGVALAGFLAGSRLALFLPFPAAFAWTAMTLAAASRMLRAERPSSRLLWAGAAALAWGQLAAAHFAHGAVIGTLALATFVAAKVWAARRSGVSVRRAAAPLVPLGALMVGLNLAFFLPRLAYLPATSYGPGYATLSPLEGLEAVGWPLALAAAPGGYLGITALVLALGAWMARPHRPLATGFAVLGAGGYLVGLDPVARLLEPAFRGVPLLDFYVHFPGRFSLALVLALPVLAALAVHGWVAPRRALRPRTWVPAAGAVLWVAGPLAVGMPAGQAAFLGAAATAAGAALFLSVGRTWAGAVIPAVLAAELVASGLWGLQPGGRAAVQASRVDRTGPQSWTAPLAAPDVDASAYLRPDPIVEALRRAAPVRYVSRPLPTEDGPAYLVPGSPALWGLQTNQRAMLFGIEDVQGYNPVQLGRFWRLVRSVTAAEIPYNLALFDRRPPAILDLLQVGFVIGPAGSPPEPGAEAVAERDGWALYGRDDLPPRAWAPRSWVVAPSEEAALAAVTEPGFDPEHVAVLETGEDPLRAGSAGPARVSLRAFGPQAVRVDVDAATATAVVLGIPFERGWHAQVDGRPAALVPADYLLQAVIVPPGRHRVTLAYDDPWIGYGLLGSALAAAGLGAAVAAARRRERSPVPRNGPEVSAARSG